MPHITDEEEWELYCLNRLGDARRDEIDEHLLWCTPCQAAYHDCAETNEVFTAALREVFRQPQLPSEAEAHRSFVLAFTSAPRGRSTGPP